MPDNSSLKILSRSLKAISKINRDLLNFKSEKNLCQAICNDLVQIKGYKFVWMGLKENGSEILSPIAIMGKDRDFVKSVKESWDKYSFNDCPASMALKRGRNFINKDLKNAQQFVPWDKNAIEEGFLSVLILPIRYHSDVIGTLHVYSDTKNYFLKEEISFLKEVAGDISLGIKSIKDDRKSIKSKIEYKELTKRISSCVAIYEAIDDGNDFLIKDFNKAAEKAEKLKRKDIIGKNVLKVFPVIKDFGLFDVFKRVYKTGRPESYPISIYKDKRISGWRENFVYKLSNGDIVAVYNDLTEKKKAEEEIKSLAKFPEENPDPVGRINYHGKLLYCNHTYKKIFNDGEHVPYKIKKAIKKIAAEKSFNQEVVEIKINARIFLFNLIPIKEEDYINFYGRDITEQMMAEKALRESEEKYRTLVEKVNEAIFIVQDGIFVFANPRANELMGISETDFVGKSFIDFVWPGDRKVVSANYRKRIAGETLTNAYDFRVIGVEGEPIWVFMSAALIRYKGKPAMLIIVTNVNERKKAEERILYLSFHDHLTGLYNRRFFEEELKRLDTKRQLPLSLIMGDLNGLKLINDVFGHLEGDRLLKETAEILKKVSRSEDILARWGGDEFVLLLPKTSILDSEEIVQRIIKEFKKTSSQKIPKSLSLGAATKEAAVQDIQTVILDAESNMYKSKLGGKESLASSIIFALMQALYEKSNETKEHTDRIHDLSLKLGKSIKLPSNQLDELSLLTSLHDIGKVAIPETILLKEGSLTEQEWESIKKHPEIGFNIAQVSPQIAHIAKPILSCHENWDGSGYPLKLKGESIPIISRIVLIADAYDVMTNKRPYNEPISKYDAIKELKRCAGSQFDPVLVDKFIEILPNS